jgi:hypothetical protein
LGLKDNKDRNEPVKAIFPFKSKITSISAGGFHSIVVNEDNEC